MRTTDDGTAEHPPADLCAATGCSLADSDAIWRRLVQVRDPDGVRRPSLGKRYPAHLPGPRLWRHQLPGLGTNTKEPSILHFHPYPRTRLVMVAIPVILCRPQALSLLNKIVEYITSRVVDLGVRYREGVLRSRPVRVPRLGQAADRPPLAGPPSDPGTPAHGAAPPRVQLHHHVNDQPGERLTCPGDYPIFAGVNNTPLCACVLHALSTRARKGTSVRPWSSSWGRDHNSPP
jgi:hypothetical protein